MIPSFLLNNSISKYFCSQHKPFKGTSLYYFTKTYNECKLALILIIFVSNILRSIFLKNHIFWSLTYNLVLAGIALFLLRKNLFIPLSIVLLGSLRDIKIIFQFAPLIILFSTDSKSKAATMFLCIYAYQFIGSIFTNQEWMNLFNKQSNILHFFLVFYVFAS